VVAWKRRNAGQSHGASAIGHCVGSKGQSVNDEGMRTLRARGLTPLRCAKINVQTNAYERSEVRTSVRCILQSSGRSPAAPTTALQHAQKHAQICDSIPDIPKQLICDLRSDNPPPKDRGLVVGASLADYPARLRKCIVLRTNRRRKCPWAASPLSDVGASRRPRPTVYMMMRRAQHCS
jgi:hypothetical protein